MSKYLLLLLFLSVFTSETFAQRGDFTTKSRRAIKFYKESENYMVRGQFPEAIELLQKAIKKDDEFIEAHIRLGQIYKKVSDIDRAIAHLQMASDINKGKNAKFNAVLFDLAELYLKKGDYNNVAVYAERYLSSQPTNKEIANQAEMLKKNAEYALENISKPLPFKPKALTNPINQFELQYFPVLTVDQKTLIFTRREGYAAQYDEDIYISYRQEGGGWSEPQSISPLINTAYNEGTCTISADGRTLIFTSCEGRKGFGSCDLFVSYKIGDEWSAPENMGKSINSSSWESQPALSADGRTLYFISSRAGGYGKRDIWFSTRDDKGNWNKAKNCGSVINSPEDEVSPYIHVNDKTLYFSSKRYPGYGGFDLFYSEKTQDGWSEPENIGYPINTSDDQVSLFITADGTKGYYSHEVRNKMDQNTSYLYEFDIPSEVQVNFKSNYVRGKVYDAETKRLLKAKIELYDIAADSLKGFVHSDSISGEYLIVLTEGAEYALYVNKKGYLFESLSFDYREDANLEPVEINIYLKPVKMGMTTVLKNIFFEVDDFELKEKSKTELNRVVNFLKLNPKLKIEITGHTDNTGSKEYNRMLSLNRAKAVYDYLVKSGIDCDRINVQGYGDSKPVAPNDSEVNKQKNRRIEFKILK